MITAEHKQSKFPTQFLLWFGLSLGVSIVYAGLAFSKTLGHEYLVQDDARVYLIWMQKFIDPELFPQDLIADYYQSVTPWGYAKLYQLMANLGVTPILLHKLIPMGLGLLTTTACFVLSLELIPHRAIAFLSTLLLNQAIWLKDDLVSATPRGFLYPLFLAFLYFLIRREWIQVCIFILLLGLFYPTGMLLAFGLICWQILTYFINRQFRKPETDYNWNFCLISTRKDLQWCLVGLGVTLLIAIPYALSQSQFGPAVTAAEGRTWIEFSPQGRLPFFHPEPWVYWLKGNHSGISFGLNPGTLGVGFLLPFLWWYPTRFPLLKQLSPKIMILPQLVIVSLGWFILAHSVLFKLYLPSRYTQHTLRIAIALCAAIALGSLLQALAVAIFRTSSFRRYSLMGIAVLLAGIVTFYPNLFWGKKFPRTNYVVSNASTIYQFLKTTPKNSLIASLSTETNNVPIFAQRRILAGQEFANPYHVGFYRQIRQRADDLIRAHYSPNLTELKQFITQYQVDFWLVQENSFTPEFLKSDRWLKQYQPTTDQAIANLEQGISPTLQTQLQTCSILRTEGLVVLSSQCILNTPE